MTEHQRTHPIATEEQAAPVDWQAIARQRERELKTVGERKHAAEQQLAALRQIARGYCPACGRGDAAPTVEDWERERKRAETAEHRLSLAHQARRAKEHQLDDIRRALCDAGFIRDDDPYSHADLADVIRQAAPAEDRVAELSTPNRPTFRDRAETAERNERELRAQIREYEDATTWQTTCLSCADTRNEIARQLERAEQATLRAERAEAALERVRALHRKASHGETCVYCAHGQRLGYDTTWPCDTIRALAEPAPRPDTTDA